MRARHFLWRTQADRQAAQAGTAGTADAVHVHFRIERQLVVDHQLQLFNIQTARSNVSCYQHPAAAVGKTHQHLIAIALFQIAMQRQDINASRFQRFVHALAIAFGVTEHHARRRLVMTNRRHQYRRALIAGRFVETLFDGGLLFTVVHFHIQRLALHASADAFDPARIGCGEQQRLTLRRRVADHIVDIVGKAHVQHAVGFVQHQHLQFIQHQRFLAQVFLNTPRRAHHDMRRVHQRIELRPHRLAPAQGQNFDVLSEARQTTQFFAHLVRQLTRRAQDQCLSGHLGNVDFVQQANAERRRFTAAGFCFGTYVLPFQDGGQCGSLHRRHFGIPQFVEVGQLFGWQRQGRKRNCAHGDNSYMANGMAARPRQHRINRR
ncbi:hypothetical protein D3C80_953530 [compost metagenome]